MPAPEVGPATSTSDMLAFIISVRHPDNASDYRHVERLLERTLASVSGQEHRSFRIVVVGNRHPEFDLPECCEFVAVDFPPPSTIRSARTEREAVLKDKGTKLAVGLLAAREHEPDYAMTV